MASFVTVVHAARQYKIQCTPSKLLNDVLVEACGKVNVDADLHGLRHGKNTLDLSMSMRLAHLPGGAKLDLIRVAAAMDVTVNVALNMPDTPRRTALIPPSHSLWLALEVFESQSGLTILSRASQRDGQVFRQQAVVQLMNREYSTDEQLRGTTLASLGIKSGSAVLRVSFKQTDDLVRPEETVQVVPLVSEAIPAVHEAPNEARITLPQASFSSASTAEQTPMIVPSMKQRQVEVLLPSTSTVPHYASVTEPDDNLSMSVAQAKAYQTSLANRTQNSTPLLTQKYRDQQALEKRLKSRPELCRVKFRFPDGTQVIGTFNPSESASELYGFVDTVVQSSQDVFELEVLGDRKRVPRGQEELWRDLYFGKAVVVQVLGHVQVREEYRIQGKDIGQVIASNDETLQESVSASLEAPSLASPPTTNDHEDKTSKKIPKWLQKSLGKK